MANITASGQCGGMTAHAKCAHLGSLRAERSSDLAALLLVARRAKAGTTAAPTTNALLRPQGGPPAGNRSQVRNWAHNTVFVVVEVSSV